MTEKISGSARNVIFVPVLFVRPDFLGVGLRDFPFAYGCCQTRPSRRISTSSDGGEGVDDGEADAVEASRDLVRVVVELPAGVEVGEDDLERLAAEDRVEADRDAAAVVLDGHGLVRRGR